MPLVLVLVVASVYQGVPFCGFFMWDDADLVQGNPDIRSLGWDHIRLFFTKSYLGNYHPLTMLSLATNQAIGNGSPRVFHSTNLILHTITVLLVCRLAGMLSKDRMIAFGAALFYAVHPTQVESVAWIAERKNVLYGPFYFAAAIAYVGYLRSGSRHNYLLALGCFVLSLLSKGQAVTLPFALAGLAIIEKRSLNIVPYLRGLLPFLLIGLVFAWIAIEAQQRDGYLHLERTSDLWRGAVLAGYSFSVYLIRLFVPMGLSAFYPIPASLDGAHYGGALLTLLILAVFVLGWRRKWYILVGCISFYAANILPIIQLLPFGEAITADRYLYVASFPVFLGICWALQHSTKDLGRPVWALTPIIAVALIYALSAHARTRLWCDSARMVEDLALRYPESDIVQFNKAVTAQQAGDLDKALVHYERVVQLAPTYVQAWHAMGLIHQQRGEAAAAIHDFSQAIKLAPTHGNIHLSYYGRAQSEKDMGLIQESKADVLHAIALSPAHGEAYYLLGLDEALLGDHGRAIRAYTQAEALGSDIQLIRMNRAISYGWLGNDRAAIADLDSFIAEDTSSNEAFFLRGIAKARNRMNGCADLQQAQRLGHPRAAEALTAFCRDH